MSPLGSHIGTEGQLAGKRGQLYEAIRASPGVSRTDLSEKTGIDEGTLRHHARLLEHWGFVRGVRADRNCRYFIRDGLRTDYAAKAYACNPTPARLLAIVKEEPGLRRGEIAQRAGGLSWRAIAYHLKKSIRYGLLSHRSEGARTYWPAIGAVDYEAVA